MSRALNWVEEKFMPPLANLSEQKHLKAIRDGVIATLPLIIVGCFFLIAAFPPIPSLADKVAPYVGKIIMPYRITMGLMSIYATYTMGFSLAKSYKLDGISGGVLSLVAFLMLTIPVNLDATLVEGSIKQGWLLPMNNLGGSGMFSAILAMCFSVEILRFCKTRKFIIKMPDQVPESVARSFEALIPSAIIIFVIWSLRVLLEFDINNLILAIFTPITKILGNNVFGAVIPVILTTLLWSAGVHGASVIGSIIRPMWLVMLEANGNALSSGVASNALPYIAPEQFYQWLVWIGGAGGTLPLCILLLFCKSQYLKQVGKFSIIPSFFNINEPLIFGLPIVLNPILAIPFILAPVVTTIISYFTVSYGFINGFVANVPWTLPSPIGAFLATSNDWNAALLSITNIIIAGIIYYPFLYLYDKKMYAQEIDQSIQQ